jgi:hypothetical protein
MADIVGDTRSSAEWISERLLGVRHVKVPDPDGNTGTGSGIRGMRERPIMTRTARAA